MRTVREDQVRDIEACIRVLNMKLRSAKKAMSKPVICADEEELLYDLPDIIDDLKYVRGFVARQAARQAEKKSTSRTRLGARSRSRHGSLRQLRKEWRTGLPLDDETFIGIVRLACLRADRVRELDASRREDFFDTWVNQFELARQLLKAVGASPITNTQDSVQYGGICDTGSWYAELTDGRAVFSKSVGHFYVRHGTPRKKLRRVASERRPRMTRD